MCVLVVNFASSFITEFSTASFWFEEELVAYRLSSIMYLSLFRLVFMERFKSRALFDVGLEIFSSITVVWEE